VDGLVIMYADKETDSMRFAISETVRRRAIQEAYNTEHGITPRGITKNIRDLTDRVKAVAEEKGLVSEDGLIVDVPKEELTRMVKDLEGQMKAAAKNLEFEKAALLRDQVVELRRLLIE
jgi:excinuclease ABC subunit B